MCWLIIVATIPTGIIGVLFNDMFAALYNSVLAIGIALLITGTMLWFAENTARVSTISETPNSNTHS